ncbi:MAG: hypothetical protein AAGJ18_11555 [Bacteroidota bacterium]
MTNKKKHLASNLRSFKAYFLKIIKEHFLRILLIATPLFLFSICFNFLGEEGDNSSFYERKQMIAFLDKTPIASSNFPTLNVGKMEYQLKLLVKQPYIKSQQKEDLQNLMNGLRAQENEIITLIDKWTKEVEKLHLSVDSKDITTINNEIMSYGRLYYLSKDFSSNHLRFAIDNFELTLKNYQKIAYPRMREAFRILLEKRYNSVGIAIAINTKGEIYFLSDSFSDISGVEKIKKDKQLEEGLKRCRFKELKFFFTQEGDQAPIDSMPITNIGDSEVLGREIVT